MNETELSKYKFEYESNFLIYQESEYTFYVYSNYFMDSIFKIDGEYYRKIDNTDICSKEYSNCSITLNGTKLTVEFTSDRNIDPHIVNINSYANNTWVNTALPIFNFTIVGTNASYDAVLFIDGANHNNTNALNNTPTLLSTNSSLPLSDGVHTWYINATNGTTSNVSTTRTINVDTTFPVINITTPDDNAIIPASSVIINANITELNLNNITYTWNGVDYAVYNKDLMLYSKMDNNTIIGDNSTGIKDISIYGNFGACIGIVGCNYSTGKYGLGIYFNGSNYISYGTPSPLNVVGAGQNVSFCTWTKKDSGSASAFLISKFSGTTYDFGLYHGSTGVLTFFYGSSLSITGPTASLGAWHHICFAVNDTNTTFYIDNVATVKGKATLNGTSTKNVVLGQQGLGAGNYMKGFIDEAMLWNRSLTSTEISNIYNSQLTKYNSTQWNFYINQTNIAVGTYPYNISACDLAGNCNQSGRSVIIPSCRIKTIILPIHI